MKRHVKQHLIRLLRLGGYTQTRGFLRKGNRYCVLGLLCLAFHESTNRGEWVGPFLGRNGEKDAYCFYVEGEYSIELPSSRVLEWAGISREKAFQLHQKNDLDKQSYTQLANWLESHNK